MTRCSHLAFALSIACGLAAHAAEPVANPDPFRFKPEIQAFEAWDAKNASPRDAVLFAGSSSVRMWRSAEDFPDLPVINRGFGGAHISDVNYYAELVALKYQPRVIVFYCGDNDIEAGKSPEQVLADFKWFVSRAHRQLPDTRILYLPIKPSLARWEKWPQMRDVNEFVRQLADDDERLTYVDTATPMLGADGRPRPELFIDDGLHLNEAGYRLWSGILRDHLGAP